MITGAASGIGAAQACLFAQKGAKNVAADINLPGLERVTGEINSNGGTAFPVGVDIASLSSMKEMVRQGIKKFSCINILSNTAGILDNYASMLDTSEELWDQIMTVDKNGGGAP